MDVHPRQFLLARREWLVTILVEGLSGIAVRCHDVHIMPGVRERLGESLCVALGTPNGRCIRVCGENDSHVEVPCGLPVR